VSLLVRRLTVPGRLDGLILQSQFLRVGITRKVNRGTQSTITFSNGSYEDDVPQDIPASKPLDDVGIELEALGRTIRQSMILDCLNDGDRRHQVFLFERLMQAS
jgi:hypothetical protein